MIFEGVAVQISARRPAGLDYAGRVISSPTLFESEGVGVQISAIGLLAKTMLVVLSVEHYTLFESEVQHPLCNM